MVSPAGALDENVTRVVRGAHAPGPAPVKLAHLLGALALGLALVPATARAYERRLTVGAEVGYASVLIQSALPVHGVTAGAGATLGLSDVWSLRGHLAYALHPADRTLHVGLLGVDVVYLVDIVRLVPYFGAGVDVLGTVFNGGAGTDLGLHVSLGAEYFLDRDWIVGLEIRPHYLPLGFPEGRLDPVYLTVCVTTSVAIDL
jgi:hypothetical protein